MPVPRRLEQPVGEAEREDVLHRLLAEEVVDPEDLRLIEGVVSTTSSCPAVARSVPNGFSATSRERSTRSSLASISTVPDTADGGIDR